MESVQYFFSFLEIFYRFHAKCFGTILLSLSEAWACAINVNGIFLSLLSFREFWASHILSLHKVCTRPFTWRWLGGERKTSEEYHQRTCQRPKVIHDCWKKVRQLLPPRNWTLFFILCFCEEIEVLDVIHLLFNYLSSSPTTVFSHIHTINRHSHLHTHTNTSIHTNTYTDAHTHKHRQTF